MSNSTVALTLRTEVLNDNRVVLHHPTTETQGIGSPPFHESVNGECERRPEERVIPMSSEGQARHDRLNRLVTKIAV